LRLRLLFLSRREVFVADKIVSGEDAVGAANWLAAVSAAPQRNRSTSASPVLFFSGWHLLNLPPGKLRS